MLTYSFFNSLKILSIIFCLALIPMRNLLSSLYLFLHIYHVRFSLATFEILSLVLWNFIMIVVSVVFVIFFVLGFGCTNWICEFIAYIKSGKILAIFFFK